MIMLKRETNHELVQDLNIDINNCIMLMQKEKFQTHHVYIALALKKLLGSLHE